MKAFLLAAGEGRRLRPLTHSVPKCLVPIRGTPLLAIWLQLLEIHGIAQVLINVHYLPDTVLAFLAASPTRLTVKAVHEPVLLGSAGTVLANRDFVEDEEAFLIIYADNLTTIDLRKLVRFHGARAEPVTIGVAPTDRPREKGIVVMDSDARVTAFVEKGAEPPSNLANAGIYVANQALFDWMPQSSRGERPLDFGHDVFPQMVPHLAAYPIQEFLMDIGTPDEYEQAQKMWPGLRSNH